MIEFFFSFRFSFGGKVIGIILVWTAADSGCVCGGGSLRSVLLTKFGATICNSCISPITHPSIHHYSPLPSFFICLHGRLCNRNAPHFFYSKCSFPPLADVGCFAFGAEAGLIVGDACITYQGRLEMASRTGPTLSIKAWVSH